ncbi:MAG: peptidylprolyl isomerase [Rhodocyclaceae bacterium]|nr:peptidylprolyl isomerase [Rhodocyclaceae bacterium]
MTIHTLARSLSLCAILLFAPVCNSFAGAEVPITDGKSSVTVDEIRREVAALPQDIRDRIVADRSTLGRFVGGILQDKRVERAAKDKGIDVRPETRARADRAFRDLLIAQFMSDEMDRRSANLPDFSALAREHFEVNRAKYARPEAVRVAHILIRVDVEDERYAEAAMRAKAAEVLEKLRAGEDFGELAKQFSDDKPSAGNGGQLAGWIEKGKTVPPFERAAFSMKVGETSDLVRTRYGFHIIKVLDHRKTSELEFKDIEPQLIAKMKSDFQNELKNEITKQFAGERPVELNDQTFEAIRAR